MLPFLGACASTPISKHDQGERSAQPGDGLERVVESGATIQIRNKTGSVRIRGVEADTVRLTGSLGYGVRDLVFESTEEGAIIEVEMPRVHIGYLGPSHLIVDIPRSAAIQIKTVSADVRVSGVDGRVDVETVRGGIEAITGASPVRVKTLSGFVDLRKTTGKVHVDSHSGDVSITADRLNGLDVETLSGDLLLSADGFDPGTYFVKTQSGNAVVRAPKTVPIRINGKGSEPDLHENETNVDPTALRSKEGGCLSKGRERSRRFRLFLSFCRRAGLRTSWTVGMDGGPRPSLRRSGAAEADEEGGPAEQ